MGDTPTITTVIINGTTFDLKHMDIATAQQLYAALGNATNSKGEPILTKEGHPKYQALVNTVAALAANYQSIITIDLPDGITIDKAFGEFSQAIKDGKGVISESLAKTKPYLKEFEKTGIGKVLMNNPVTATGDGLMDIGRFISEFSNGFGKGPVTTLHNLKDATGATITELGNKLDSRFDKISPDQAQAIGTAYAAAVYAQVDGPAQPGLAPRVEADFFDKIWAGIETGWGKLSGFIGNYVPHIPAFFKFMGKGFKDWDLCLEEAKKDRESVAPGYSETLEKNIAAKNNKKARPQAAAMLESAEEIAGVKTENMGKLIANGGMFRDHNGTWQRIAFKDGTPHFDPVKGPDDKPITADAKVNEAWNKVFPQTGPEILGMAAKWGMVGDFTLNAGRAFAAKALNPFQVEMNKLNGKIEVLEEKKSKISDPTSSRYKKLETQIKDLEKEVKLLEPKATTRSSSLPNWANDVVEMKGPGKGSSNWRIFGRMGSGTGNLFGEIAAPISSNASSLLNGRVVKVANGSKGLFVVTDAFQGISNIGHDWNAVAENGAQIAGGVGASKLATRLLPGKFKLFGGLVSFFGGRWAGGELVDVVLPKPTDETAPSTNPDPSLVPHLYTQQQKTDAAQQQVLAENIQLNNVTQNHANMLNGLNFDNILPQGVKNETLTLGGK